MPASEHMVVVEKRRIQRTDLMSGHDDDRKTSSRCRPAENRPRIARLRREKVSVENDS